MGFSRRATTSVRWGRRLLFGLPWIGAVGACAGQDPVPPLPPPQPSAVPSAVPQPIASPPRAPTSPPSDAAARPAGVDVSTWQKDWPKGWTDPRVVAALADRCDFVPVPRESDGPDTEANVFACGLYYEQACVVSACDEEHTACKHGCESTCTGCAQACTTQCGTCEAACADAACRRACAVTTSTCKDGCTRALDRCGSGKCAKTFERCAGLHKQ
jgi:hypothetical protein